MENLSLKSECVIFCISVATSRWKSHYSRYFARNVFTNPRCLTQSVGCNATHQFSEQYWFAGRPRTGRWTNQNILSRWRYSRCYPYEFIWSQWWSVSFFRHLGIAWLLWLSNCFSIEWRINVDALLNNFANMSSFPGLNEYMERQYKNPILFIGGSKSGYLT